MGSSLIRAFSQLRAMYERQRRSLPWDVDVSFAPRWATLIESPDRQRALRAFEAATLFAMRTALRNGSVWIAHSLAFRQSHRHADLRYGVGPTHRRRFYAQLGLPRQASGTSRNCWPTSRQASSPWQRPWRLEGDRG